MNRLAIVVALTLAACPATPGVPDPRPHQLPQATNTCLVTHTISDWKRVDDYRLIVWTGPRTQYLIELNQRCLALRDPGGVLRFVSTDHRICDYRADEIAARDWRCTIGSIRPHVPTPTAAAQP
jgi:hypothetical protein